jgi:hypothetical protein
MTAQGRMPTVTIRCSAGEQTRQRLAAVRGVVDDADRANLQIRCGVALCQRPKTEGLATGLMRQSHQVRRRRIPTTVLDEIDGGAIRRQS